MKGDKRDNSLAIFKTDLWNCWISPQWSGSAVTALRALVLWRNCVATQDIGNAWGKARGLVFCLLPRVSIDSHILFSVFKHLIFKVFDVFPAHPPLEAKCFGRASIKSVIYWQNDLMQLRRTIWDIFHDTPGQKYKSVWNIFCNSLPIHSKGQNNGSSPYIYFCCSFI